MTQDQNKKTQRQFQCRDYLWDIFGQMSAELECSTDYLINEAMRQYARSRNYGTGRNEAAQEPITNVPPPSATAKQTLPQVPAAPAIPSLRERQPSRPSTASSPPRPARPAPPAAPPSGAYSPSSKPPPPRASQVSQQRPQSMPPPLPAPGRGPAPAAPRNTLFVIFNGQKIPVTKQEFIIGRGSKSADLAIKDGNISRRHAAVLFTNGAYYMKDLGSTNGIEYQGRRFESKRIDEGDVFRVCDYEIRFTYQ